MESRRNSRAQRYLQEDKEWYERPIGTTIAESLLDVQLHIRIPRVEIDDDRTRWLAQPIIVLQVFD